MASSDLLPSYKNGYASSGDESAFPTFWNGLKAAWVPTLGPTGNWLKDLTPNPADLEMDPSGGHETNPDIWEIAPGNDAAKADNLRGWALNTNGNRLSSVGSPDKLSGLTAITVAIWGYPRSYNQYNYLITKANWSSHREWRWRCSADNEIRWACSVNGVATPEITITSTDAGYNEWHLYVGMWDARDDLMEVYLDGKFHDSDNLYSHKLYGGPAEIGLGNSSDGNGSAPDWDGFIGPALIYDRKLCAQEIEMMYQDPLCMFRFNHSRYQNLIVPEAGGGGGTIPAFMHHYKQLRAA